MKTEKTSGYIVVIRDAQNEIKELRRKNELLQAKVEVFDGCMMLLYSKLPDISQRCSPDVVYQLEQLRNNLMEAEL